MLRPTFVFLILKVALTRAAEVIVYRGETAVLPSRADPAWTLETIEWSTFGNDTHIATYRKTVMNLNRTRQFRGRLGLNISTGDLTIYNVTEQDAMEYSVRLKNTLKENAINSNQLTVRKRLRKPSVEKHVSLYEEGRCTVTLTCSSLDEGVDFSWEVKPPLTDVWSDKKSGVLVALLRNRTSDVEFTCTSNRTGERTSSAVTLKCENPPLPKNYNCRYGVCVVVALIVGFCTALVIQSKTVKKAFNYLKGKCVRKA
ncbi:CD48 antigen-like isoform X1 [Solea senegalensis]|nr:CD48 antigen-like isoform X1 [Solea senegalensis]